jgi:hypothetical protein
VTFLYMLTLAVQTSCTTPLQKIIIIMSRYDHQNLNHNYICFPIQYRFSVALIFFFFPLRLFLLFFYSTSPSLALGPDLCPINLLLN